MISEIIALSEWRQQVMQNCLGKHNMQKRSEQKKHLSQSILWYRNVYNQIASDAWETDNPVLKLATEEPQLMLRNCARGDTICPTTLLPVCVPAPRAPRVPPSRCNVAVVSHAQYVLTVTAARASRVKAAVSKAAW